MRSSCAELVSLKMHVRSRVDAIVSGLRDARYESRKYDVDGVDVVDKSLYKSKAWSRLSSVPVVLT